DPYLINNWISFLTYSLERLSSGGGGGDGGGGSEAVKSNPVSGPALTGADQALTALSSKIKSLISPCSSVLPPKPTLRKKANQLSFWDARVHGSVPVSMVPGAVAVPSGATIASSV